MSEYRAGNPSFDGVINDTALNIAFQDASIDLSQLPNYAALPDDAKGGETWGPLYYLTYTVMYNSDEWSRDELPTDWGGYLDDQFEGELIMSSTPKTGWMDYCWNNVDENYFQKLMDLDLRLAQGHGQGIKAVAAGERSIMLGAFFKYLFIEDRAAGTPVEAKIMDPTMFIPTPLIISDKAPHPNTAKWFINYLYSDEGIQKMGEVMSNACVGTVNNIVCNPDGLDELANQANPNLVRMFEPAKREEIMGQFQDATGQ
jgi:ABC-type Fe3+ transport system substrate-binding protein